jgi:hypothetical protein
MAAVLLRVSVFALSIASLGCGGTTAGPSPNLGGTWSGIVGMGSGGGHALRVTWTVTQNGNSLSGPVLVLTSPALTDTGFSGTLSATLTGNTLSLNLAAQPQAVSGCSLSGAGSASVSADTIAGSLDLTFVACGVLQPPSDNHFVFTKE